MTGKNYQIDSASISDRGLSKKRPQNEDSYLELGKQGLFAVADGVGGAQAGDVASQMAMEIVGEAFINRQINSDTEDLMKMAIERANEAIFQMSHDLAQLSTMATTIVTLHVAGGIATIGHVGDSRIYRLDAQGNLHRETQDHSMVEEEVRAGRMTPEQAANHPSKNIISRALGADQTVEVDLKTIMIEPNTIFLLCSDGITRHIDDFQLRELLLLEDAPADICRRMKDLCYERGAEDNLTAVIVDVTEKITAAPPLDLEESTVAAARPLPPETETVFFEPDLDADEIPTQNLVMPANLETRFEDQHTTISEVVLPDEPTELPQSEESENLVRSEAESSGAAAGKILSSVIFLIVGALLGAGIYYLLAQNNQPPVVADVQTATGDYTTFENNRRSVDSNPNEYISKNATPAPDAESLYLLGRACLLTGRFAEAKKYLDGAKNKLAQANAVNSKVLANDIALSLAVVDEAAAQTKFQNETVR